MANRESRHKRNQYRAARAINLFLGGHKENRQDWRLIKVFAQCIGLGNPCTGKEPLRWANETHFN